MALATTGLLAEDTEVYLDAQARPHSFGTGGVKGHLVEFIEDGEPGEITIYAEGEWNNDGGSDNRWNGPNGIHDPREAYRHLTAMYMWNDTAMIGALCGEWVGGASSGERFLIGSQADLTIPAGTAGMVLFFNDTINTYDNNVTRDDEGMYVLLKSEKDKPHDCSKQGTVFSYASDLPTSGTLRTAKTAIMRLNSNKHCEQLKMCLKKWTDVVEGVKNFRDKEKAEKESSEFAITPEGRALYEEKYREDYPHHDDEKVKKSLKAHVALNKGSIAAAKIALKKANKLLNKEDGGPKKEGQIQIVVLNYLEDKVDDDC
jgi:hypothetical protein